MAAVVRAGPQQGHNTFRRKTTLAAKIKQNVGGYFVPVESVVSGRAAGAFPHGEIAEVRGGSGNFHPEHGLVAWVVVSASRELILLEKCHDDGGDALRCVAAVAGEAAGSGQTHERIGIVESLVQRG